MKKKLLSIALIATLFICGCSQDNQSVVPPVNEQVDTSEEGNEQIEAGEEDEEQNNSEENPEGESKPSLPGGLVDGGDYPSKNS